MREMGDEGGSDGGEAGGTRAGGKQGLSGWMRAYLPELVYGANDGVVTTLAVVSGVTGAQLSTNVILILGFANLFADGVSMGASNVLSVRSTPNEAERPSLREASRNGLATFGGFLVAGIVPLLAYLLPFPGGSSFAWACGLSALTLFGVGAGRALFSDRAWLQAGLEMLAIGAAAGSVAYGVGLLGRAITGGAG
ncbi:MAG: VIT1/CCC1 transporter family protein [Salinarimonas sp.]